MAHRISKNSPSKTDAREIARDALQRKLQPVPLLSKSKRPAGGPGWNRRIITEDEIDDHFSNGQNVGILWGEPSHWAVDVDLDCDEIVKIASSRLPLTMIYGRGNRPRSHFIYRCVGCENRKWMDDKKNVIIEVRSTRTQSVWVGSIHPEGDRYRFDSDVEIIDIEAKQLYLICGQLAALVILARSYPGESGRHDYVHALAGALFRDGYEAAGIRAMLITMLQLVDDKEDDLEQRIRTVMNTIVRAGEGGHTRGWATLKDWIDEDNIKRVREYLTGTSLREAPAITVKAKEKPEDKPRPALKIPEGLIADVAAWASNRAYVLEPQFDLATAITCTALASGNRYVIQGWNTPLQPYIMVLAPTGGGKGSTHQTISEFAREFELRDHIFQGFQSYHAMLDSLAVEPSLACWLWDEAARKLKSAGKATGSQDYQILTHLLEMYGRAASGIAGMPGRGQAIVAIDRPFLITMATAQPDQMVEAITSADLATGLLARFLLLDCGDELKPLHHQRTDTFPSKISTYVRSFRDVQLNGNGFVEVGYEVNAIYAQFVAFAEAMRKRQHEDEHAELWNRANQNALIIAGLLAIGQDVQRPRINRGMADFSIELATRSVEAWVTRLRSVPASGDRNEKLTRILEGYIGDPRKYHARARRPKEKTLMSKGFLPRAVLYRLVRYDRRRDIDDVLKVLLEGDVIEEGTKEGTHVYWSS